MFNIGDKIVYPLHGAGIIESIECKEVLGERKEYYVLNLPIGEMKIMLPLDNIENLGLRDIASDNVLSKVDSVLSDVKSDMSKNWNRRYRDNMEKIKTGDICEVAEVVRDLMIMDDEKGLSTGEKKMLKNTKQILISELALIKNKDWHEIEEQIDDKVVLS